MCKGIHDWFRKQIRGWSFMHWMISLCVAGVWGVVSDVVWKFSIFQLVLLILFSFPVIFFVTWWWLEREKAGARFLLEAICTIPPVGAQNDAWNSWVQKTASLLRGKGLRLKANALKSVIDQADPDNRPDVAKNFLRALAEGKEWKEA